ncbi:MAG: hypothetical protein DRJ05_02935 [Bacteroidetes bacterium]|nr:MAG: hypothetical protein DRJ05_02935 [Bacteroidota bacterium]
MKNKNTHNNSKNKTSQGPASFLSGAKATNPFSVPGDYFETLPAQIQERIAEKKQVPFFNQIAIRIKQPTYSIPIAGIAAIIFLVILFTTNPDKNQDYQMPAFTLEEILNSEPEFLYEMSESQLIEVLMADNDFEDNTISFPESLIKNDTGLSDEDIIDYLSGEEFNETIIYNL